MKPLPKTILLPPGSVENFVDFSDREWQGRGIHLAGLGSYPPGYRIYYPSAKRHNVLFCVEGELSYELDGVHKRLTAGQMLVQPARECQSFWAAQQLRSIFFLLRPGPQWGTVEYFQGTAHCLPLLRELMGYAWEHRSEAEATGELSHVRALIHSILERELSVRPEELSPLYFLQSKLRSRPSYPWTIAEMASECRISAPYLHALCKREWGISPYQMLLRIRMEQAQDLLRQTGYSVKIIASLCGYNQPISFTRAFTATVGISPTQFRLGNLPSTPPV